MALYPSLEDMKIDQLIRAEKTFPEENILSSGTYETTSTALIALEPSTPTMPKSAVNAPIYPYLGECMHLELSPKMIAANMPEYLDPPQTMEIVIKANNPAESIKNHLTDSSIVRPVNRVGKGICDKLGQKEFCRCRWTEIGISDTPDIWKLHSILADYMIHCTEDCLFNGISAVFCAARKGVMTNHSLFEVINQNIGLKDNEITKTVAEGGNIITNNTQFVDGQDGSFYSWI